MSRYYISEALKRRAVATAKNRCGYCLVSQDIIPIRLTIEHIIPRSAGGSSEEENLWLSCSTCNNYKGSQIKWVCFISVAAPSDKSLGYHTALDQSNSKPDSLGVA